MTQKYGKESSVTALLDKMDFIILPVLNVDGYAYTWKDPVGQGSVVHKIRHLSRVRFFYHFVSELEERRPVG